MAVPQMTHKPKIPLFNHIITIDKIGVILGKVGWRSWANSREEQQKLTQQLIELRDDLQAWNETLLKEESS